MIWDNQKDSDVIAIDVEFNVFWDALTNPDTNSSVDIQTNMEKDVFWDAQTNVDEDSSVDIQPGNDVFWDVQTEVSVDNRLESSTDESVIIQAASSDDFWEIWNELNKNKFIDIQSELEKINNWAITADNENIGELDTKTENVNTNPNMIDKDGESLNALPYDEKDLSGREPEKVEHEKNNKYENKKEKQRSCLMPYLICFLILFSQVALGKESGEITKTNRIRKGNLNPMHQNASGEERITKRQINDESFKAYYCEDEEEVATAEFSLNPPKECNRADGSAYYPPTPSKAQILQQVRRIPIKMSICRVE